MKAARRGFLVQVLPYSLAIGAGGLGALEAFAQAALPGGQAPPQPIGPGNNPRTNFPPFPETPKHPEAKLDPRAALKKNQEELRRDVKRLAELVRQLESEMEKTDAAEVLSLQFMRKAEEIEKLARNIKNLARG